MAYGENLSLAGNLLTPPPPPPPSRNFSLQDIHSAQCGLRALRKQEVDPAARRRFVVSHRHTSSGYGGARRDPRCESWRRMLELRARPPLHLCAPL